MGMWELSKHSFNGNLRKAVKHRKNSCLTKWKCLLMRHKRVKLRPETKSYMQTDDKNSCKKKKISPVWKVVSWFTKYWASIQGVAEEMTNSRWPRQLCGVWQPGWSDSRWPPASDLMKLGNLFFHEEKVQGFFSGTDMRDKDLSFDFIDSATIMAPFFPLEVFHLASLVFSHHILLLSLDSHPYPL